MSVKETARPGGDGGLRSLLDDLAGRRVLCLGDIMLDRYVYGSAERVSQEAPIPILKVRDASAMLGGVGNVARNIAAMGGEARVLSVCGDDEAGRILAGLGEGQDRLALDLLTDPDRPTTVKTRYVAAGQQLLRTDEETERPVGDGLARALGERLRQALGESDALVVSDYAKGVLADAVLGDAIARARDAGLPVIVDPKRAALSAYAGASVIKPNLKELAVATGLAVDDDDAVEAAARAALADAGVEAILVSRSARGVSLVPREGPVHHFPSVAREVYDVSGAGDTVIAALALCLAAGAALPEAARLASVAGGIAVEKLGTAAVGSADIADALRLLAGAPHEAKRVDRGTAADRTRRWRQEGKTVALANGCFDLLHRGHLSMLRQARDRADRLVVALNTDASVRRLKGADRPLQDEDTRAAVLAALEMVDLVVLFAEDTPVDLINALRPHLLVKGDQYDPDSIPGVREIRSWGGSLFLAQVEEGYSTTGTVARMRDGPSA